MKYNKEDINKFRDVISKAMDYAEDAKDNEVVEGCDEVLDFLVYILDIIERGE